MSEKFEPSTQIWPSGTRTSLSGYGGRVLTMSPSNANILLTSRILGSTGDLISIYAEQTNVYLSDRTNMRMKGLGP